MKVLNINGAKFALGLMAGVVLTVGRAGATSSETFTVNYASSGAPYVVPSSGTNTYTFGLPQFNPALGILQDVVLTLTSYDEANVVLYNISNVSQNYSAASATIPVAVNLSLAGLGTLTTNTASFANGSVGAGLTTLSGSVVMVQQSLTLNSSLLAYVGTGNQSFTVGVPAEIGHYSMTASGPNPSSLFVGGSASTYGNIQVKYDYAAVSPVPEPGTLSLCALAAVAGVVFRRRVTGR